jgi:hypothetical protein
MGVDRNDYIIYGWKLPFELKNENGEKIDIYDDKYLPYIEGRRGIEYIIIVDNTCGKYIVFGLLIETDRGDLEGWNFKSLDLTNLDSEQIKYKYFELFGVNNINEPNLFIFSHYS